MFSKLLKPIHHQMKFLADSAKYNQVSFVREILLLIFRVFQIYLHKN